MENKMSKPTNFDYEPDDYHDVRETEAQCESERLTALHFSEIEEGEAVAMRDEPKLEKIIDWRKRIF